MRRADPASGVQRMVPQKPEMKVEDGVWVIRVPKPNGAIQEFRCASESQAKHLFAVLAAAETTPPQKRA